LRRILQLGIHNSNSRKQSVDCNFVRLCILHRSLRWMIFGVQGMLAVSLCFHALSQHSSWMHKHLLHLHQLDLPPQLQRNPGNLLRLFRLLHIQTTNGSLTQSGLGKAVEWILLILQRIKVCCFWWHTEFSFFLVNWNECIGIKGSSGVWWTLDKVCVHWCQMIEGSNGVFFVQFKDNTALVIKGNQTKCGVILLCMLLHTHTGSSTVGCDMFSHLLAEQFLHLSVPKMKVLSYLNSMNDVLCHNHWARNKHLLVTGNEWDPMMQSLWNLETSTLCVNVPLKSLCLFFCCWQNWSIQRIRWARVAVAVLLASASCALL
jgi:hypothetical protein